LKYPKAALTLMSILQATHS